MSCFSAPCGYLTWTRDDVESPRPSRNARGSRMASTASGLFDSMPTMPRSHRAALMMRARPSRISAGRSSISRWSAVSHGSHSAPFRMTVSIGLDSGGDSLTCVGKAAPPRPTRPASLDDVPISSGVSDATSGAGLDRLVPRVLAVALDDDRPCARLRAGAGTCRPPATLPEIDACTGTETKPAGLADLLADLDLVADRDARRGRRAKRLPERNDDALGQRRRRRSRAPW